MTRKIKIAIAPEPKTLEQQIAEKIGPPDNNVEWRVIIIPKTNTSKIKLTP